MVSHASHDVAMLPPALGFLAGGGEATRLILRRDWSDHPLGPPKGWPDTFKTVLATVLNSPESMILCWGRDELFFFFNEAYFPMLGPRLSWAMGARFDEVWSDGLDQARPIIADAFAGQSRRFVDMPWKLATDRGAADTWWTFSYSRVLDPDGSVAGLFIFTNETTERVLADDARCRAQRELEELNATLEERVEQRSAELQLYQDIIRSDPNPVVAFDAGHAIIACNDAFRHEFERVYGHRPQAGEIFPALFLSDQARLIASYLDRALAGEAFTVVERFGHPDRSMPMWEIYYNPLRGSDGTIIGVVQHGVDVNDRVLAEEELIQAREALRQAQKMEAVGQLTGGLAHDFNNLLTGIMGNLELLQARIARGRLDGIDRFVDAAQGAGRRAAALTQRLLAFSRRQTLDPKPTDVNRLIAGMEELLRRTVGGLVQIEVVGSAGLWTANIDAGQLENAVLNLCINARDAMPDGGRITIETANTTVDERAGRERDLKPGQYLSVCVTDTGCGMSTETIERAFEPFFTTKPIGQGTGLGLSMIYGFAQQSGGQVRLRSEIGAGTTVAIYLPRHAGDAETEEVEDVPTGPEAAGGQTVLVIDDEATIRHLVDEVLDEAGFRVIGAADGATGIKLLQSSAHVELLITDVGLPNGMNGRQVADAARFIRPGLKVLFITGYADNAAVGNGHLEPGMELLTKPFSMSALRTKVHSMIGGA